MKIYENWIFCILRDSQQLNNQGLVENGTSVYYNQNTGTYTIFIGNDETHDNILITTHDKDLLLTIVNSVIYSNANKTNNTSNSDLSTPHTVNIKKDTSSNDTSIDDDYYEDYSSGSFSYSGSDSGSFDYGSSYESSSEHAEVTNID